MNTAQVQVLKISIMKNPIIEEILKIAPSLRIPNWYLGAGCIAQTIWNEAHGFDPIFGIKDYDIVYFDASDLSYETEDRVIKPVKKALSHLNVPIDVVNEARVHLWYRDHFGFNIKPYDSSEDAISNWPTTATSIGVRHNESENFDVCAPFGLEDLFGLVVRPNKKQITKDIYLQKVERWIKIWPKLKVIPWLLV
ncbi:MAG: nucleotidyltransferase family protein [Thermoplasmataceae archaeon]